MSWPFNGFKAAQTGLVDMGDISFYNNTYNPNFNLLEIAPYQQSFSELVLNVTWAQLQATEGGALTTGVIDSAIAQVIAYNAAHGTDLGIKLRVWGGYTAPEWAKNINGAPITVPGPASVDPAVNTPQTIGRFWSGDYVNAWTSLQNTLATRYDSNPVIRGISQTAGANATDEPFVPLKTLAQVAQLQAGGYTDAAEMLTLRGAIADYAQWSTTPLDYTMNTFHLYDSGNELPGGNFTLAVLQQARNSSRLVQAGNHALGNPLYSGDVIVYGQMQADAALNSGVAPGSFQTNAPIILGPYSNWQATIVNGVALNAGNIELWDFPTTPGVPNGFLSFTPAQVQGLAAILAAGSPPPTAGAPTDGSALGFIAPGFVTGAPGTVAFTGTNAVLVASANPQANFIVTLQSMAGGTLGIAGFTGAVIGSASGPAITLSGSAAAVNTVLAHLTDRLQSGTDVVHIAAFDNSGNIAIRDVGVQISSAAASAALPTPGLLVAEQSFAFNGGSVRVVGQVQVGTADISSGIVVVGGVQSALSVAGKLDVQSGTSLLAALSPSAYSTASLTVGGTLEVHSGGTAFFSGSLSANTVQVDNGGFIHANGTLTATGGAAITNNGTIEAVADQTLGLQRLNVTNGLTGSGSLLIDAGATLRLGGSALTGQTITFAANTINQLANGPYSPSTLVLAQPAQAQAQSATIKGFTFADQLVLEGVTATSASYLGTTLTVNLQGGGTLNFTNFTGSLTGLSPTVSSSNTISFTGSAVPSVVLPLFGGATDGALLGAPGTAVVVPNIVLAVPFPNNPPSTLDMKVTVTVVASAGRLTASDANGSTTVTGNDSTTLTLVGTLDAVERSLQTLAYRMPSSGAAETLKIKVADYAGTSPQVTINVTDGSGLTFNWGTATTGDFADQTNWGAGTAPPGGANIASFGAGTRVVSGDGAVGQILNTGTTTLTGQVIAQGSNGVALLVDSGGLLTLAGGAQLIAQQQATVGGAGRGVLALIGGALSLTGPSTVNSLVIGEQAGSTGTVLDLEQILATGTVVVGSAGTGTLELLGVAASVSDGGAYIGQFAGSHGSVIVNGGEWMTAGQLTVGNAGTGSLLINGMYHGTTGQVTAYNATIGGQAGGQGSVTLDGGEMLVANAYGASSTLAVGAGGPGSLVLANGSEVAVGAAYASVNGTIVSNNGTLLVGGTSAGATGLVRVGSYSSLLVYGDATIGSTAATGVVTVGQGSDHNALFALIGGLQVNGTGQVNLGGVNAQVHATFIDVAPGGIISGAGTLSGELGGNHTVALTHIDNEGSIMATGGNLLVYGTVTGSGTLSIAAGATLTLQGDVEAPQTLAFGPNAQAVLNDPHSFHGTITGFGTGDLLDLASTQASNPSYANGVLTLATPFGPLQFNFNGPYSASSFSVQPDGHGGTYVSGGQGDVHIVSFDGFAYDFQAVGQFVAARSTGSGTPWQVQIQTDGTHGVASYTTGLATSFGNAAVIFAVDKPITLHVDGAPDTVLRGDMAQSIPGGTFTPLSADTWRVTWNTGETIVVSQHGISLDWQVAPGPHDDLASLQGLLGTNSAPWSYLHLPDGMLLRQAYGNDQMVGAYADGWRVAHDASLLDHHAVWDHHAVL